MRERKRSPPEIQIKITIPKDYVVGGDVPEDLQLEPTEDVTKQDGYKANFEVTYAGACWGRQVDPATCEVSYIELNGKYYASLGELHESKFLSGQKYAYIILIGTATSIPEGMFAQRKVTVNGEDCKSQSLQYDGYTFTVVFDTGSPAGSVPTTGDNTPILLTAGLLLLSGAALIVLRKRAVR